MKKNDGRVSPEFLQTLRVLSVGLASMLVWFLYIFTHKKKASPSESLSTGMELEMGPKETEGMAYVADAPGDIPMAVADSSPVAQETWPSGSPVRPVDYPSGAALAPLAEAHLPSPADSRWMTTTKYIAAVGLVLAFLWLVYYSRGSLILIIFAALIALLTRPVIDFLRKRLNFSPGLSVVVVYLAVLALLIILPLTFIPNLVASINELLTYDWNGLLQDIGAALNQGAAQSAQIPLLGSGLSTSLQSVAESAQNLTNSVPTSPLTGTSVEELLSQIGRTVGIFAGLIGPLASGFFALFFMVLISLQMSLSGGQMRGWVLKLVPDRFAGEINALLDRILSVWVSFLHGQFSLMVVMGVLVWLMNALLGTPQAMLLGFLAGLFEVIPSLGPIIATIPAAILALIFGSTNFTGMDNWVFMLVVIMGYVLINFIENQWLVPQILGDALDLPSVVVLIGVTIAGSTAGVTGVFLATPVIATGKELLMFVHNKITETPAAKPPGEAKPSLGDQLKGLGRKALGFFRRRSPPEQEEQPPST